LKYTISSIGILETPNYFVCFIEVHQRSTANGQRLVDKFFYEKDFLLSHPAPPIAPFLLLGFLHARKNKLSCCISAASSDDDFIQA
jgi:hypothetical protein